MIKANTGVIFFEAIECTYYSHDTVQVAQDLIGKVLVHDSARGQIAARIVETEAYTEDDPACHAYANFKRKQEGKAPSGRSAQLYAAPGTSYIYLNYGVHWLFNVVTEREGTAGAVLVRAVEPLQGIKIMQQLRPNIRREVDLTNGPGKLSAAMGITRQQNAQLLDQGPLRICHPQSSRKIEIVSTTRIGISKAQERPWRFYAAGNPYISKP